MPAEWKLSPVRRRSQPRTVGPEPQAARIDSRGGEPALRTAGHPRDPARNPDRRRIAREPNGERAIPYYWTARFYRVVPGDTLTKPRARGFTREGLWI